MYKIELRTPNLGISNFSFNRIVKSVYQLANCAFFAAYDKDYKDLSTIKQAVKKGYGRHGFNRRRTGLDRLCGGS